MFSQADYALAARLLGLPMPVTPAEQAAAAPMTARVLRDFMQMRPPSADGGSDAMYTGATRSLNSYPDVEYPMVKAKLASRLRTEVEEPSADQYLAELLEQLIQNPELVMEMLALLDQLDAQEQAHMDELSSQRPPDFDMPNEGTNYSMLNAPASNTIPPSVQFQQLS
ncbi:MAG: hypothetical protein CBD94_01870 [Gammaproteobacteria bacterium TMED234]|nr:MAG: hypothetical protein CBD94_01870 [Gammaproteobacteria bacterium TMED234]